MSARLYGLVLSIKYGIVPLVCLITMWGYVSAVIVEYLFASIKGVVGRFVDYGIVFILVV